MPGLPHDAFPQLIETARLRLRRPRPDENGLCAQNIADAYATRSQPLTAEQADAFGNFMVGHWERYGFGFLFIGVASVPDESPPIGHAGFKYVDAGPGHWAQEFTAIELGYALVPAVRRNGYATEAARALLAAAFAAFDLPSIRGRCRHDNPDSAATMQRSGMTEMESSAAYRHFVATRPVRESGAAATSARTG